MRPLFVNARPLHIGYHNLLVVNRTFHYDFAVWSAHKTLAPKFNSVSTGGRFVADAVGYRNVTTIGDRMATLNCLPRRMLRLPKFFFLTRVPPDCGGIKNNLRSVQSSQSRRFRLPLVPANADTDLATLGLPRLKSEIAWCEIEFLLI